MLINNESRFSVYIAYLTPPIFSETHFNVQLSGKFKTFVIMLSFFICLKLDAAQPPVGMCQLFQCHTFPGFYWLNVTLRGSACLSNCVQRQFGQGLLITSLGNWKWTKRSPTNFFFFFKQQFLSFFKSKTRCNSKKILQNFCMRTCAFILKFKQLLSHSLDDDDDGLTISL